MSAKQSAFKQGVTANRLTDGAVVYLVSAGRWSELLSDVTAADSKEGAERLMGIAEQDAATKVVGPYLIDLDPTSDEPEAVSLRERLRAAGPSVRLDLGYQAERD